VAAAIIMPVIAASMANPQLAVLLATLLDSGACALPISGFPNALALSQKDSLGRPFLSTIDYLKTGVPVGIMAILLVNSVGNFLALMVGV
jgi:phosphate transporter